MMSTQKVQIGDRAPPMAMPVCLVGAMVKGKANFCAVAWFTILDDEPPMIAIVLGKERATKDGIIENGTFSVNIPSEFNVAAVDHCGINSGYKVDKSKVFSVSFGTLKTAPLADEQLWSDVLNLGGDDVLTAPFDPQEVYQAVSVAYRRRRSGR